MRINLFLWIALVLSSSVAIGADKPSAELCNWSYISKLGLESLSKSPLAEARRVLDERLKPERCWSRAAYIIGDVGTSDDLTRLKNFILNGVQTDLNGAASLGVSVVAMGKIAGRYRDSPDSEATVSFLEECSIREFWRRKSSWRSSMGEIFVHPARSCINALGFVPTDQARSALFRLRKLHSSDEWMLSNVEESLSRFAEVVLYETVDDYLLYKGI